MNESLFTPLKENNLTSLKIRHDWKTGEFYLSASKEWEKDFVFSKYNKDFFAEGIYTNDAQYLNTQQVYSIFEKSGLTDYLNQVLDLIRKGKHVGIECYFYEKYNIRFICNQHSFTRGINNKSHSIMAGGIRRHSLEEPELDVIIDGLNLGRAMSFKNVAIGLNFGGCKSTVHMDPLDINNMDIMGFLAFAIDRSRSMTGPDMNFPTEMADVMTKHFSMQYTGGPNSPLGETGKPTSHGTYLALKEAVDFRFGTKDLKNYTVAIQGLGAIGWYMAEYIGKEGGKIYITDINKNTADKFIKSFKDYNVEYVKPDDILDLDADILCPSAIGGIIHEGNIDSLKFKIIFGSANNQLRASSKEEEIVIAKKLAEKGILYQVEWWHNTAGVLCGAEEYFYGQNATYENLVKKIETIIPEKTKNNLKEAKSKGITPTENAYLTCENAIYI